MNLMSLRDQPPGVLSCITFLPMEFQYFQMISSRYFTSNPNNLSQHKMKELIGRVLWDYSIGIYE